MHRACVRSVLLQLKPLRHPSTARNFSIDLSSLNPAQFDGVTMPLNLALVCKAGPGSGKTRVLAYRAAYILTEHQVPPKSLLALTFTTRAATEMQERIKAIHGEVPNGMIRTFHSFCMHVLRTKGKLYFEEITGSKVVNSNFGIFTEDAGLRLLKKLAEHRNAHYIESYDTLLEVMFKVRTAQAMRLSSAAAEGAYDDPPHSDSRVVELARELLPLYTNHMYANNLLDFDSFLLLVHQLLDIEDPRHRLQQQYRHILVDEFQDTNVLQYEILKKLCPPELLSSSNVSRSLFIVGDANQSIYGWRGAMPSNMSTFAIDYRTCVKIFTLRDNYRSTEAICKFANGVLGEEGTRANSPSDGNASLPEIIRCSTDENQAKAVVSRVLSFPTLLIAILFRTNVQSRALERELVDQRIPYTILKGLKFYARKEVKDVICFLQVLSNPMDLQSLTRAFDVFNKSVKANSETAKRGPGAKTFEAFIGWAAAGLLEPGRLAKGYLGFLFALLDGQESIPLTSAQIQGMRPFAAFLHSLDQGQRLEELGRDIVGQVVNFRYLNTLSKKGGIVEEGAERHRNVEEVLNAMRRFDGDDLTGFLDEVHLMSETSPIEDGSNKPRVHLMTIHASKGLEYPCVIFTGAEDYTLSRGSADADVMNEQRRVAYVAVTRAKSELIVTYRSQLYEGSTTKLSRFFNGTAMSSDLFTSTDSYDYL